MRGEVALLNYHYDCAHVRVPEDFYRLSDNRHVVIGAVATVMLTGMSL